MERGVLAPETDAYVSAQIQAMIATNSAEPPALPYKDIQLSNGTVIPARIASIIGHMHKLMVPPPESPEVLAAGGRL
jgi:hypothetical protein